MRLILKKRTTQDIPFGLIYGTIVLVALAAARFYPVQDILPSCSFRAVVGVPCPTCGTTRLMTTLAHGDLVGAIRFNPAVALAVVAALILLVYDAALLFGSSRRTFTFSPQESRLLRLGAVLGLLANWVYLIICL